MGAMKKIVTGLLIDGVKLTTIYPFNTLLVNLIELVAEQEGQMSSLEFKLDQHMTNPFKVGKQLLEEASYATSKEEQQQLIKDSRRAFLEVTELDLPGYRLLPIQACLNVGLCYQLLSERENSIRWYKKAFEQLTKAYPREHKFSVTYENDLQNYENLKAAYQKATEDYEQRLKKYDANADRYQKSLEELSYLSDKAKIQISGFILKEMEVKAKRSSRASDSLTKYLDNPLDPKINPRSEFKPRSSQTTRFNTSSYQFENSSNLNRPLSTRRNYKNPSASLDSFIETQKRNQAKTLEQLYRVLGIPRDAQKDMPYLEEMINAPKMGPLNLRTSRSLEDFEEMYGGVLTSRFSKTPEIIKVLRKILKNNQTLLDLIKPPAELKAPNQPQEPRAPETLMLLEAPDEQDEGVLSKLFDKWTKSEAKFNREVVYLANDLSKLLNAVR